MSNDVNTQIKENLCEEVESMTVMEFQDALDKAGLEGNSVIDSLVENLVEKKFENLPDSP
jgi:hypothetical protein|tara:strand:+ start:472 stop:651 length:180 start_codon:yes stop_codon:yes gene_type:complete